MQIRNKILSLFLLFVLSANAFAKPSNNLTSRESEKAAERPQLLLATGEDKVVDLKFSANVSANGISVGNPKVVGTTLVNIGDKQQVIFKPLAGGDTTVTIRDTEGFVRVIFDVKVTGTNLLKTASEIRDLLKDIEGIDVRILGSKIVIDGEVISPQDYSRLYNVISDKSYSELVMNLTTLSGLALQLLAKKIQGDVNVFAPAVTTRVVNGQIWLEGTVDTADQATRSQTVAELYIPDIKPSEALDKDPGAKRLAPRSLVQNFIVVNAPPPKRQEKLVRVTVHFVELDKDYSKVFSFKWQPGFTTDPQIKVGSSQDGSTGATLNGGGASFTATLSSLFPKLVSAQNAGFARILKTGTVVVRSGKQATITEETQIPFAVIGPNGQPTSSTAGVGVNVTLTPTILGQGEDVELDVDMKQTNDAGRTPAGAPITSNHTVKTKLYVKSNDSAAIAGMTSSDVKTLFNKDDPAPGSFSGTTSPLFTLLRSKAYNKKKSQFVIFVTPQVIEDASDGTQDLKKNFRVKVN